MQNQQNDKQASPLVSFIITHYNLPIPMLCHCLDSILAISLQPSEREVIVIDDGSDISPLDQLKKYANDIIYFRQPNAGLGEARNRGIQTAKGEYLQFIDGDDYLLKTPYEHCIDIVRHQKPDVIMFDFTDKDNKDTFSSFNTSYFKSGTEYLSHHNLQATACCYLFKHSIIGGLRFAPGIYHEDEEFTPQLLLRAETICSTDAQAYFYRQRPHSITTEANKRHIIKRLNDSLLVIKKLDRIADTLPSNERMALSRRIAQLTMDYIYNIIMLTRSRHYLDRKLAILRRHGLFPLPERNYTIKYMCFRRLANNSMGLTLLTKLLPLTNKER